MNESNNQNIAKGLTLTLSAGEKPFALEGEEENFGPDDWAWLFLRMNKKYKIAYAEQETDTEDETIALHLVNKTDHPNVKADRDGSCGSRFGLGAWLNPEEKFLPALKYGSWFFPLKRPITEDPLRTEVSAKPYLRSKHPFSNDADAHPHLLANETPFGYRARAKVTYPRVRDAYIEETRRKRLLVAIDCGVPPDGQMLALRTLAEITRRHLRQHGWKTHRNRKCYKDLDVRDCDVFAHMKFERSGGRPNWAEEIKEMDDVSVLWCVITIDALGPLGIQTKAILSSLKKKHTSFVRDTLVAPYPIPGPFPSNLPTCIVDGKPSNGGNYLKALLVVAELAEKLKDTEKFIDKEIMSIIRTNQSNRGYANTWREPFHSNINDKYIKEGLKLIEGGYKWLIHAQKPDSAPMLRPPRNPPPPPALKPIGAKKRVRPEWD